MPSKFMITAIRRFASIQLALVVALVASAAWAMQKPAEGEHDELLLKPSFEQQYASNLATKFLTNYHYKDTRLDDELSGIIFHRYLELLDPNRSYFLASDIQTFERYRQSLDDALRHSDLLPAYDIFN
ncbi:MAG TPA: tail-specific protease, partial [Gammaproteobacteria bacterium]|nr:tail-specific protease [Gammaproteobacteria bacterium]